MAANDERESILPPPNPSPSTAREEERDGLSARPKKLIERIVKKTVESGFEAISKSEDTVRSVIDKIKDQEIAQAAIDQIDETKNGLYRAVAKEMRDFLQNTSLASEFKKALTGLAFEVKMEVRFKATEDENGRSTMRPSADVDVTMKDKGGADKDKPAAKDKGGK
ncbi:MAG: hypothetical protein U0269_02475 [Polyangiales bacterium]